MKKVCIDCGVQRPIKDFSVEDRSRDGRQRSCKACRASKARASYQHGRAQEGAERLECNVWNSTNYMSVWDGVIFDMEWLVVSAECEQEQMRDLMDLVSYYNDNSLR